MNYIKKSIFAIVLVVALLSGSVVSFAGELEALPESDINVSYPENLPEEQELEPEGQELPENEECVETAAAPETPEEPETAEQELPVDTVLQDNVAGDLTEYLEEATVPDAPVLKKTESTAKGIRITWKKAAYAVKYRVYRKSEGAKWEALEDVTETSYLDKTAVTGELYFYAVSSIGEGKTRSAHDKTGIGGVRLKAVSVSSAVNTADGVRIGWTASKYADGYRVFRKEAGGEWEKLKDVKGTSAYEDQTVQNGKVYEYAVEVFKVFQNKKYFGYYNDAHTNTVVRLNQPKLTEAATAAGGIQLSWKKVKSATSYQIFYKDEVTGKWVKLGASETNSYYDKTAKSGSARTYTVKARNGSSASVVNRKGITGLYIAKTKLTSVSNDNAVIQLSWKKVGGITGYRIYRKAGNGKWKKLIDLGKITNYSDTSAQYGILYEYKVQPYLTVNRVKQLAVWDDIADGTIMALAAPQISTSVNLDNSVTISWAPVQGAKKYALYRKQKGKSWELICTLKAASYLDPKISDGLAYNYAVRAISGSFKSAKTVSSVVKIPADLELPEKRYLNLGWKVDPRSSGGPADYCSNTTKVNTNVWTNHFTYKGDDYKPQAGDIITYGHPDANGVTQEHVDICVESYDEKTGNFVVISGNWGGSFTSSPIARVTKSWKSFTSKKREKPICNIWECKLSNKKRTALINSAERMLNSYQENPDYTRGLILACKYTNWCDVFVAYTIYVAKY